MGHISVKWTMHFSHYYTATHAGYYLIVEPPRWEIRKDDVEGDTVDIYYRHRYPSPSDSTGTKVAAERALYDILNPKTNTLQLGDKI